MVVAVIMRFPFTPGRPGTIITIDAIIITGRDRQHTVLPVRATVHRVTAHPGQATDRPGLEDRQMGF